MNRQDIGRHLIASGAHINAVSAEQKNGDGGNSALWYAVQGRRDRREGMVGLLLEHGADANLSGEHGWTPLHMASQWNHPASAKILLQYGAEMARTDSEGRTALEIAEKYASEAMIELLSPLSI